MYRPSPLLFPVLFLPGILFEAGVRTRDLLYSAGLFPSSRLPRPVISIGNLTLGGSGKTPLAIHVVKALIRLGQPVAVLSRGYGRLSASSSIIVPPANGTPFLPAKTGDEPALIRRYVPEAWIGISPNRYAIGLSLALLHPKLIFVLDDGFQHRRLHRDLDIVVIDRSQPLIGNRLFPRGSLREPLSSLRRSHAVVLTGGQPAEDPRAMEGVLHEINPKATVFHCRQEIGSLIPFALWNERRSGMSPPPGRERLFLTAAIGNPMRFRRDVEALGIRVTGSLFYRDHHALTRRDWQECIRRARLTGAEGILITEKDAVKTVSPPDFPLLVAVQSTQIDRREEFEQMLTDRIQASP
jgi:tetraacyldisaccharide 4'-kinase